MKELCLYTWVLLLALRIWNSVHGTVDLWSVIHYAVAPWESFAHTLLCYFQLCEFGFLFIEQWTYSPKSVGQLLCEWPMLIHISVTLSSANLDFGSYGSRPFHGPTSIMQLLCERALFVHNSVTLTALKVIANLCFCIFGILKLFGLSMYQHSGCFCDQVPIYVAFYRDICFCSYRTEIFQC